jgi:signal transduction histidine kinase
VAATAAVGTVHQLGPFDVGAGLSGLIDLQVFLGVVSAVALFLGGAVDEREGAASALRRSEARLAAAFDHVPFELFLLDDGLTCVMQNATSRASWGDQRGRTPATTTLPEPVIRVFRPKLERALGGEVVRGEATYGEGAEARRVLEVFAPVREGDRFVGLLGVHVDLSDRVRAEAERERLQAQLAQTQRMDSIGRLAGGIALDINNLLTPILGYAELALDETPTTMRTHGWLEGMGGAARRIQDLTGKLLAFGRRQPPLRTTVELGAQVRAFAGILRRTIREDVRIELDLDPAGVHVRADPALLDQVLLNLVVNAQDAIEGRGVVTISTRRRTVSAQVASAHELMVAGGYGALAVRDTGAGMDAETLARAFEPFFTTKAAREGNGLGLATVYGIVRGHGGGVVVTSAPGEGSTFEALLPEVEAPPVSAAASTPPTAPSAEVGRGRRVLLVEDEAEVRSLVRDVLVARGHEVTDLGDPRDALALASDPARRVDLLLTDDPPADARPELAARLRREARPGRAVHDRPRRRHPRAGGPVAHRRPGPAQALQRRGLVAPWEGCWRRGEASPPPRAGARGRRGPRGCSCRPPTRGRRPVAQEAAHDLAAARLRERVGEAHVRGARELADRVLDVAADRVAQRVRRGLPRLERHEGAQGLARQRVGPGHDCRLGDAGERHDGGLDLHGREAVAAHVEHVVHAAEDAEIAVHGIADGAVAGQVDGAPASRSGSSRPRGGASSPQSVRIMEGQGAGAPGARPSPAAPASVRVHDGRLIRQQQRRAARPRGGGAGQRRDQDHRSRSATRCPPRGTGRRPRSRGTRSTPRG